VGAPIEYDTEQSVGSCQWRLVSYRGTLNQGAVFGPLSNVETVDIQGSGNPTDSIPAAIFVSPSNFTLGIGDTRQLTATVLNAGGDVLSGVPISWSSTAPLVATILSVGATTAVVTGLIPGSATIEATIDGPAATSASLSDHLGPLDASSSAAGLVGTSNAVVSSGTGGGGGTAGWPNEPSSFTLISDRPVANLNEDGWSSTGSRLTVQNDPTAPLSPPNVLQFSYPQGEGGPGKTVFGGTTNLSLPAGTKRVYLAFWMKLSDPWQEHPTPDSPKLVFIGDNQTGGGGSPLVIDRHNDGEVDGFIQNSGLPPNRFFFPLLASSPVNPGAWARVEIIAIMNSENTNGSGPRDGELHIWVNGTKTREVKDLWYSEAPNPDWDIIKVQPLWGGQGATLTQTNYLWVDHLHVSGQ